MDNTKVYEALLDIKQTLGGLSADMTTVKNSLADGGSRMESIERRQDSMDKDVSYAKGKTVGMSVVLSTIISLVGTWWMGHGK